MNKLITGKCNLSKSTRKAAAGLFTRIAIDWPGAAHPLFPNLVANAGSTTYQNRKRFGGYVTWEPIPLMNNTHKAS